MPSTNIPSPFELVIPQSSFVPLIVESPHSGSTLPDDFDFICSLQDLRQIEDSYVDQFAENIPLHGGTFLHCLINRGYLDLNRSLSDLYPDLCSETIPWPLIRSKETTEGIGLIHHLIRSQKPIYAQRLSFDQILLRIKAIYEPYYYTLQQALHTAHAQNGFALHISLHSTPKIGKKMLPDIIIGDHDGHSCGRMYREWLKDFFTAQGLSVTINDPYKGRELTRRFARPRQGFHSIQIDINKLLYMYEASLAKHEGFDELQVIFNILWRDLSDWLSDRSRMTDAAE
jgi:N-formylglutamate deformylase